MFEDMGFLNFYLEAYRILLPAHASCTALVNCRLTGALLQAGKKLLETDFYNTCSHVLNVNMHLQFDFIQLCRDHNY